MRLAADDIVIRVEGMEIVLHPTLRAAYRLERQFDGFAPLLTQLAEGSLTAMAAVIREAATAPTDYPAFLERIATMPLKRGINGTATACIGLVCALAGIGQDEDDDRRPSAGPTMTAREYHERLYRIGTGWLGWTPEQTWRATPAEIMAAHEGRIDLLTAIFGSGEKGKTEDIPEEAGISALKAMQASGENKAR